jgi:hypothetical protein
MSLKGIEKEIYVILADENTPIYGYGLSKIREDMFAFMNYDEKEEKDKTLTRRKNLAVEMTKRILDDHGKASTFAELLEFLEKIEIGAQFFDERLRDHLIHSFNNYLLGLYLMCKSERIQQIICEVKRINPLVWKLSSLLHDIGYPVEILRQQENAFFKKIEDFKQARIPTKHASLTIRLKEFLRRTGITGFGSTPHERYFRSLEKLYRGDNAFRMIEDRLSEFGFDIDLRTYFYEKANEGFVDHGILSALIMLNLIDAIYAEHNPKNRPEKREKAKDMEGHVTNIDWGRKWFDKEIVDAAAVVSLHNLVCSPILQGRQIALENMPILYLLVLSDNVQVWRRHSVFRQVYPPDAVNILFAQKRITCTLAIADEEKSEARDVLENRLGDSELTIKVQ